MRLTTTKDFRFRRIQTCECIPVGDGLLSRLEHERDCPLRLWGEEREAYLDQVAKDKRNNPKEAP